MAPPQECLSDNWKEEHNLQSNILYKPSTAPTEPGYAFCVTHVDGADVLIVFQTTITEMHSVNADDLRVIHNAYGDAVRDRITRRILIFVTPIGGKLHTWQPLYTTNNAVPGRDDGDGISAEARNFEQWVHRKRMEEVPLNIVHYLFGRNVFG